MTTPHSFPHQPRQRFGQNFLHDAGVIQRIISAINPKPQDKIVEIGPGLGALTTHILPIVDELDVVELDRDIIPHLEKACVNLGKLRIHQADALRFDFTQLTPAAHSLRVIGNLPYNISTPLLFHLIDQANVIQDMYFMLQKEVVERLAAQANEKAYGRLGIMVQYHCQVTPLFTVHPGAFTPVPKVDSAIVRLVPYDSPPFIATNPALFADVVRHAFSHRRKTLRNSLKDIASHEALSSLGIDSSLRPENISLEDYVRISNALTDTPQM